MAHESIVYGSIIEPSDWLAGVDFMRRSNDTVFDALPLEDEWPFFGREMFHVPSDRYGTGRRSMQAGVFDSRVIHLGASFKEVEREWHEWLEKFEGLLRDLFWVEANVHLRTVLVSSPDYHYEVVDRDALRQDPPSRPRTWTLEGGPRCFFEHDGCTVSDDTATSSWLYSDGVWTPRPSATPL